MIKNKVKIDVDSEMLLREIPISLEAAEKRGQHTDKLGRYLIAITEIMLKQYNISVDSYEIENLQQEVIIEMIETINRKGLEMKDPFNYLYYVGRLKLHEQVMAIRKKSAIMKELQHLIEKEQDYINTKIVTE